MLFNEEKKNIISTFYCNKIDIKFAINNKTKPDLSFLKKLTRKKLKKTPLMRINRKQIIKRIREGLLLKNGLNVAEYGYIYVD